MTPFDLAQRYLGIREIPGAVDHPLIQWWLSLTTFGTVQDEIADEVPWCSAFVNGIAWELRLPRSKSAMARSWLAVGLPVVNAAVHPGDVVILSRGMSPTAGHVGFFAGWIGDDKVRLLGGNQGNSVSIAEYGRERILGIRRLTS